MSESSEFPDNLDVESSSLRAERKTTGRLVAIVAALFLLCIALYQTWIRKTAVVAGVIAPVLIMVLYAAYAVLISQRNEKRRLLQGSQVGLVSWSTSSLPAIKLKRFGEPKCVAVNASKFCRNGKIKRKYRRKRLNAERRRHDFLETKRKLLAQRTISLPQHLRRRKLFARIRSIC